MKKAKHLTQNIHFLPSWVQAIVLNACVAFSIVRVSHRNRSHQYAINTRLNDGTRITRRLPDLFPTLGVDSFYKESSEYQAAAALVITAEMQRILSEQVQSQLHNPKFPTVNSANEPFLAHFANTRRGSLGTAKSLLSLFANRYGELPISNITRPLAREYAEYLIALGYAPDTVRLALYNVSSLIEFLREEDAWTGANPFHGLWGVYSKFFNVNNHGDTRIPDHIWDSILFHAARPEFWAAGLFICVSYHTGLRPHEVRRLDVRDIDRDARTWRVLVTKTAKRPYYRTIAIPQQLITYLNTHGITDALNLSEVTVARQIRKLREEVDYHFVAKSFRKDFAARMEVAGAPPHIIDLHQGRAQTSVLHQNYLTAADRAATICRDYIERMFATETRLVRVK